MEREWGQQQGMALVEGHARPDHVHVCLSLPPKYRVAHTVGCLKGQSASRSHRECLGREKHFTGVHCWARGAWGSTVGLDEQVIREDIRTQDNEEKGQGQMPRKGL